MCTKCDRLSDLVDQVNAGEKTIDRELLSAMVAQLQHVLQEMQDDIGSDKSWLELLNDLGMSMTGLGVSLFFNANNIVAKAHRIEQRRIAESN